MSSAEDSAQHLTVLPGHLIRRLQQIAVALFLQETAAHNITPVQYAALRMVAERPGVDQRSLARLIGFDTSTIGGVIDRLEGRGLMVRNTAPNDRRVRQLVLSEAGLTLLGAVEPDMRAAQARILAPLAPEDQQHFMRMLNTLVEANNAHSRAPSER